MTEGEIAAIGLDVGGTKTAGVAGGRAAHRERLELSSHMSGLVSRCW